jgi:hypothetical protein
MKFYKILKKYIGCRRLDEPNEKEEEVEEENCDGYEKI